MTMWVNPWGGRCRTDGPWTARARLGYVAAALAATVPVWPVLQPGDPVADEMLSPAEVAVTVPVVLLFPAAWALLGRSRRLAGRIGAGLVGCVVAWSLATSRLASYATPPTVDDVLRGYLVVTGIAVGVAGAYQWIRLRSGTAAGPPRPWWRRLPRPAAGVAVWSLGCAATLAVPVVGDAMVPPRDALLPLPPTMAVVAEEAPCRAFAGNRFCVRRFTVAASDHAPVRDLVRGLGEHLRRKGWQVVWYDFTPVPDVRCRPVGLLANPYRLCADLRVDPRQSTVEVQFGYANPHDPVY